MFTIVINGRTYKVKFLHLHETKETFCSILNPETGQSEAIISGVKFNKKDDKKLYSKWSGKMLALTKVLKLTDFSKDERREIWLAFHENFPRKFRRH